MELFQIYFIQQKLSIDSVTNNTDGHEVFCHGIIVLDKVKASQDQ